MHSEKLHEREPTVQTRGQGRADKRGEGSFLPEVAHIFWEDPG